MPQPQEPNALAPVIGVVPLPQGANAIYQSNTGAAGAQVQAAITPSVVTRRAYLTKAILTSGAPNPLVSGIATISDGTWTLNVVFVETVTAGGALILPFGEQPLVASAPNTPITVTIPAIGGGAVAAVAVAGYEL